VTVHVIPAAQAIAQLAQFDTCIDARSPSEYAEDHLPGATNWPALNDEERHLIGTIYKQVNPFEAKKRGAGMVAANIARHIEREVVGKPKGWQPLLYCWRGGKRSGSLALVLDQIGFRVHLVEGGYKAFRAEVLAQLPAITTRLRYQVVCGPTGSGKTRLLHALKARGAQVLDLEDLANHRSSVLGLVPGQVQPTQKRFDTLVWQALRAFDPARPVFVESESKKVGNVSVPEALITAMRASPCVHLQLSDDERVALLLEDYEWFVRDPHHFCERLAALTELRGKAIVDSWQQRVRGGHTPDVVRELLVSHYDPMYAASIRRNFTQWEAASTATPRDRSMAAMDQAAVELMATLDTSVAA